MTYQRGDYVETKDGKKGLICKIDKKIYTIMLKGKDGKVYLKKEQIKGIWRTD